MASHILNGSPEAAGSPGGLVRGLRLMDATTLVMGSMIGSGIFIVSADVARRLASPGLLMTAWLLAAILTLICAVSYGALAAALPYSGGPYVYLREAFGPLWGFLYGWAMFGVIQTGTIAAVCVAFGKFLGVLAPGISPSNYLVNFGALALPGTARFIRLSLSTEQFAAIYCVGLLTALNCYGLRVGALLQNLFTFAKAGALLALIVAGALLARNSQAASVNFTGFWRHADWSYATASLLAAAMVGPLFASDAWNNITFTGEEVRNPRRNLPLSLLLGVGAVSVLYLLINLVYLAVLPLEGAAQGATVLARGMQYAASDRVGTAAAEVIFGPAGLYLTALAVIVSTFGCANGMILAGARIYYAMSRDGLFFASAAAVHPRYRTPAVALILQGVWTAALTLSGTYSQLLDYIVFTVLLFYMLTLAALFVLRRRIRAAGAGGPALSWGYPWLPAAYIAVVGFIELNLLAYKPGYTWPGLILVLAGVPVYFYWKRKERRSLNG